jgi:hypothetical protein
MPKISLSIPHQLGQEEAKRRIVRLITENRAKAFDGVSAVAEEWNGYVNTFSFRAKGFAIDGKVEAQAAQVVVEANLPFLAMPFKGRIEEELLAQGRRALG